MYLALVLFLIFLVFLPYWYFINFVTFNVIHGKLFSVAPEVDEDVIVTTTRFVLPFQEFLNFPSIYSYKMESK